MVYNDFKEFGWQPFLTSWLDQKSILLSTQLQVLVNAWFQDIIDYKRMNCNEIVQTHDLNLIASFCKLWDCVAQRQFVRNQDDALVKMYFLFCVIWSIGATTDEKGRQKMDFFVKEKTGIFPLKGTVYDYFIEEKKGVFLGWETLLPVDWKLPKE
jgi:dynein heavy chain, axonemal